MSTPKVKSINTTIENNSSNIQGIINKLQGFLNTDIDEITDNDIDNILNLYLPTKQVDNLIKVTNHTNESLRLLKNNLIKNRNLMAEEISCLNECFESCVKYEDCLQHASDEEAGADTTISVHLKSKNPEEVLNENKVDPSYGVKMFIQQQRNRQKEILLSPPSLAKGNWKSFNE